MRQDDTTLADPLIDEVRARRRQLLEEHGNDLERLAETIRRLQSEHPQKVKRRIKSSRVEE